MIHVDPTYLAIYLIVGLLYCFWNEHQMDDPPPGDLHLHVVTFLTTLTGWPIHATLWIRYFCSKRST